MSIDLYADFNEELDAQAGDFDDDDNREKSPGANGNENDAGSGEDREKVEAKIKIVKVKRKVPTLNAERLKGPRGIIAVEDFYKDMKFKGKGYEKQDLDEVMNRLEHWAHRMFPKYNFDDSLSAIERLGKKKEINVHMIRYRMGQLTKDDENRILLDEDEQNVEGETQNVQQDEPMDEFEALIDEQIALSTVQSRTHANITSDRSFGNISSISGIASQLNTSVVQPSQQSQDTQPSQKAPSTQVELSDEMRARIAENKQRALAILEQRKKEEEEKRIQKELEERQKPREISDICFDDDDF